MAGERADDGDVLRLPFTHLEPYLRRTYKGTTAEMKQVVVDALAGKAEPPDPNQKEKPGIGPEVEAPDKPKDKDKGRGVSAVFRASREARCSASSRCWWWGRWRCWRCCFRRCSAA